MSSFHIFFPNATVPYFHFAWPLSIYSMSSLLLFLFLTCTHHKWPSFTVYFYISVLNGLTSYSAKPSSPHIPLILITCVSFLPYHSGSPSSCCPVQGCVTFSTHHHLIPSHPLTSNFYFPFTISPSAQFPPPSPPPWAPYQHSFALSRQRPCQLVPAVLLEYIKEAHEMIVSFTISSVQANPTV